MSKKLLIDLLKLRDFPDSKADAVLLTGNPAKSFKTVRELATFLYTCRRCENAPCINACPAKALEKEENGIVSRAVNLCIRCKSCIVICPFGTLMNDLFEVKTSGYKFFNITDENSLTQFAELFPDDVICIIEKDANPDENIYALNEKILIKESIWS
ncbi:MAG: hypothetical protein JXJ22_07940 [Bacteroidales bacterium]|nr:hypothetical protein [Bacteroidales bacterium]